MDIIRKLGTAIGEGRLGGKGGATGSGDPRQRPPSAQPQALPEGMLRAYITLQVSPRASEAEIAAAYRGLQNTWRLDRYPNERWQAEASAKLGQLRDAYEQVLRSRHQLPEAAPAPAASPAPDSPPPHPLSEPPADAGAPQEPSRKPYRFRFPAAAPWRWIVGGLLLAAVYGILLWPGIYRYDSLKVGSRIYPLRIHMLTGKPAYYDGSAWVAPPIQSTAGTGAGTSPAGGLPPPAATGTPAPARPTPESTLPRPSAASLPSASPDHPAPAAAPAVPPAARTSPRPPVAEPKSLSSQPPLAVATPRTAPEPRPPTAPAGPAGFSIQLRSFQEEEDALDFLKQVRARLKDARIEEATVEGKGTWYRILAGSFAGRQEALHRLRTDPVFAAFPGSFVQQTRQER